MKNIFLIISFVSLCISSGFGQNKIEMDTYDKLVDYVSCRYVNQYINNYQSKSNDETAGYEKIKKRLDKCKIETSLSFDSLKIMLKANHWGTTAGKFETWKNTQKVSDISKMTNSQIINAIISIDDELKSKINEDFIAGIKTELLENYPDHKDSVPTWTDSQKEDINKIKRDIDVLKTSFKWALVFVVIIILSQIFLFFKLKLKTKSTDRLSEGELIESKIKETIIKTVLESKQITNQFKPQIQTKADNKYTLDEKEFNSKVLRIIRLDEKEKQMELMKKSTELQNKEVTTVSEVKFLKEREGLLLFKETSQESAYYELFNINGNKASYRFCGNEDRAIENYDAVLKDVFDDDRTYSLKAKKIIIGEEGSVEFQPDGKWKIVTPAKIEFI